MGIEAFYFFEYIDFPTYPSFVGMTKYCHIIIEMLIQKAKTSFDRESAYSKFLARTQYEGYKQHQVDRSSNPVMPLLSPKKSDEHTYSENAQHHTFCSIMFNIPIPSNKKTHLQWMRCILVIFCWKHGQKSSTFTTMWGISWIKFYRTLAGSASRRGAR